MLAQEIDDGLDFLPLDYVTAKIDVAIVGPMTAPSAEVVHSSPSGLLSEPAILKHRQRLRSGVRRQVTTISDAVQFCIDALG